MPAIQEDCEVKMLEISGWKSKN